MKTAPINLVLLMLGAIVALARSASATELGPATAYWLTAGDQHKIFVVQGTSVQTILTSGSPDFEYPIAISSGTARTFEGGLASSSGYYGRQYTLDGSPTGVTYRGPATNECCGWDGTTDGTYNYTLLQASETILRYNTDWTNPTYLFTGSGMSGSDWGGITYDSANNTLWTSERGSSGVLNKYSMTGTLIATYNLGVTANWGLAYEQSSDSLWLLGESGGHVSVMNVSTSGQLLSNTAIPALDGNNILGGEMSIQQANVPEPMSFAVLSTGIIFLHGFRHRNAARI